MNEYLLSVWHGGPETLPTGEDAERMYAATGVFNDKMVAAGRFVFAGGLHPIESSTVVNATGPDVLTTDGPYVETKEYMGGFWIMKAQDLDEALDWARQGSRACGSPVEVRPFQGLA